MRLLNETKAQIAILDIEMPRLNGIEAAQALQKMRFPAAIVFLNYA